MSDAAKIGNLCEKTDFPEGYSTPKKAKIAILGIDHNSGTPFLASHLTHEHDTPSKTTNTASILPNDEGLNSTNDLVSGVDKNTVVVGSSSPLRRSKVLNTGDSCSKTYLHGPLEYTWTSEIGAPCEVALAERTHLRLRSFFTLESSLFYPTVRIYLKRKFIEASIYSHLCAVPVSFYVMAKELFNVSHELFADAINCSGILPHFCSIDADDVMFGSSGTWESVEDVVQGGVGFPPFTSKMISEVISKCESNVRKSKPYCRLFLLPLHEKSPLRVSLKSENFYGEIIARFEPGSLSLRHQMDILQAETLFNQEDWSPKVETALVLWVNEPYRILYPVPIDLDDCLVFFIDDLVGGASGLNFSALWRSFPRKYRKGDEKAESLEQLIQLHQDE